MPWDDKLTAVADSITGPVAKAIGVIAIALTGPGAAFSEGSSWVRRGAQRHLRVVDRLHRLLLCPDLLQLHRRGGFLIGTFSEACRVC
jgi:hypothetical protein